MASEGGTARRGWRDVVVLVLTALLVVVGADLALRQVSRPRHLREVVDAIRDYRDEDPTVLVLGSSHARTFDVMDEIARERTQGRERILAVPLEWGKFRSYEWVLRHRVEPLVDEVVGGKKKRPSLKRFILQTAWWDACALDSDPPVFNLPSRAWSFEHFVSAVARDGLNDHSRNYVTSRWLELWQGSILVSDRGHGHILTDLRERYFPLSPEAKEKQHAFKLKNWQALMERGKDCIGHPAELAAAERILDWGKSRGYDTTLFLYPMMPVTVTEFSREHVQEPYQEMMRELAARKGVRFIDTTFDHDLTDAHFQPDFDHMTPAGHVKFSEWVLDGKLAFLLDVHEVAGSAP